MADIKQVTVRLPAAEYQALEEAAKASCRSVSNQIRYLVALGFRRESPSSAFPSPHSDPAKTSPISPETALSADSATGTPSGPRTRAGSEEASEFGE